MRHDCFSFVGRAVIVAGAVLVTSSAGCEKVPTFQELTQQGQPAPASGTPVDTPKQASAQQPVAVVQAVPQVEDPQKVIADFQNKPPSARTDQDMARIVNLSAGLDAFSSMDLNASGVTDDGLKHLAKLSNLESLSLAATRITNTGLSVALSLPKLTKLNLKGCTMTLPMVETLSKMENLESLSLESTQVGDNELPPLVNLSQLKELDLGYCPITDNAFKTLGSFRNLSILRVYHTSINGSGMQFMKRKKSEVGLRVLNARATRFGEQGLQLVKGIETLEELDIASAEVTDRLLSLNLKGLSHLKKLDLSFNGISDQGTQILGTMKSLEDLSLFNCQSIGDQTLFILKGNKALRVLTVSGSGVTEKGKQSLKKFLPDCEFR